MSEGTNVIEILTSGIDLRKDKQRSLLASLLISGGFILGPIVSILHFIFNFDQIISSTSFVITGTLGLVIILKAFKEKS